MKEEAFRTECVSAIQAVLPPEVLGLGARALKANNKILPQKSVKPVQLFFQDEGRFGLFPIRRRRLTAKGVQPIMPVEYTYQTFYLYGAFEPKTGENFLLELPAMNAPMFQLYLEEFSLHYAESLNVMILDNGGLHRAKTLHIPENVRLVFLPPYCPELNPAERYWRDIKDKLAQWCWKLCTTLEELSDVLTKLINRYTNEDIQSLTMFPYIKNALYALQF